MKTFFNFLFALGLVVGGIYAVEKFAVTIPNEPRYSIQEIIEEDVEVIVPEEQLDTLIERHSRARGVPPIVVAMIINRESRGNKYALHQEPHNVAKMTKKYGVDFVEGQNLASGWGLMQVTGAYAVDAGEHYTRLFDPDFNIALGTKVLADCYSRVNRGDRVQAMRTALKCYNGSGEKAEQYSKEIASEVVKLITERAIKEHL